MYNCKCVSPWKLLAVLLQALDRDCREYLLCCTMPSLLLNLQKLVKFVILFVFNFISISLYIKLFNWKLIIKFYLLSNINFNFLIGCFYLFIYLYMSIFYRHICLYFIFLYICLYFIYIIMFIYKIVNFIYNHVIFNI